MRYLFQLTILFFLFIANILISQVSDSLSNDNNLIYHEEEMKFQEHEIKIAKLEAARDAYTENIQFFSLLIIIIFTIAGSVLGFYTLRSFKRKSKNITKRISKFQDEFGEYKLYLNDVIISTRRTTCLTSFNEAKKYYETEQFEYYLIDATAGVINSIQHIDLIKDESDIDEYRNDWIELTRGFLNGIIDTYNDRHDIINDKLNSLLKNTLIVNLKSIINLKSELFHSEVVKIKLLLDKIENVIIE